MLTSLGRTRHARGEIQNALEANEEALKIFESLGDRWREVQVLSDIGYEWKMNLPLLSNSVSKVIDANNIPFPISNKTLFIRADLSGYINEGDFDLIFEKFPNAKIETIKNSDHWVHAEKPQQLLELVSLFLSV